MVKEEPMSRRNTRYPDKVVTFAVSQRATGVPWDKIRRDITKLFKIEPPTARRMRDWVKLWGEIKAKKAGKYVTFNIPKRWSGVFEKTHDMQQYIVLSTRIMSGVYNAWQRRDDPMAAWVLEILHIIEEVAGRKAFDDALTRYQEERTKEAGTRLAEAKIHLGIKPMLNSESQDMGGTKCEDT